MDIKSTGPKPARSLPLGYRPPAGTQRQLHLLTRTRLPRSVAAALGDHALILASALAGLWAVLDLPAYLSVPVNFFALVLIASRQRGLENLVHEASHRNWTRRNRRHEELRLNDRLCDLLAGLPVFSTVASFRVNHDLHHLRFGTEEDLDNARYSELDVEGLNRTRQAPFKFVCGVAVRLRPYARSWRAYIRTTRRTAFKSLAWHAAYLLVLGGVAGLLTGAWAQLAAWLVPLWVFYWLVPMTLVLTPLRFVAEAGEHTYVDAGSVFEATFTNEGRLGRLLHPHHDGYHLIHHLFPSIPHHQLKRAHRFMLEADPQFYGALNRHRVAVLQVPRAALKAAAEDAPK
ncbi:MAG TPA: fatty acid desaturase [Pyrinomonadaceae bacterium]|nr:fatty acid desaturase [Pyrinomonadaceae bacterium]